MCSSGISDYYTCIYGIIQKIKDNRDSIYRGDSSKVMVK